MTKREQALAKRAHAAVQGVIDAGQENLLEEIEQFVKNRTTQEADSTATSALTVSAANRTAGTSCETHEDCCGQFGGGIGAAYMCDNKLCAAELHPLCRDKEKPNSTDLSTSKDWCVWAYQNGVRNGVCILQCLDPDSDNHDDVLCCPNESN